MTIPMTSVGPVARTETSPVAAAYAAALKTIAAAEPDVADAIAGELASQRRQLKLIASENYASPAVLLAMGNWLSDKYAEGTIGRRLYAGCEVVDRVESVAAGHARALFGAEHAYVQPHSGIDANLADVAASFGLTGRQAESALLEAGVVTNRNSVPGDTNGAWYTSGVRLGTPALTTLGFGPDELDEIAGIITTALRATTPASAAARAKYTLDDRVAADCRARCAALLGRHPLYPGIEL
jgi:glycine/serine hydroxymethyltransferase